MFCAHIYSVRYAQDARRNAQNLLQSFIVFYVSKIPIYATENKVAQANYAFWDYSIFLLLTFHKFLNWRTQSELKNSTDIDSKDSDGFISPNWPKYCDSNVHGFWTLSIVFYSKKETKFQKLLTTSGVRIKSHLTEKGVLKQWVHIL